MRFFPRGQRLGKRTLGGSFPDVLLPLAAFRLWVGEYIHFQGDVPGIPSNSEISRGTFVLR